jgi:hypothetical protein
MTVLPQQSSKCAAIGKWACGGLRAAVAALILILATATIVHAQADKATEINFDELYSTYGVLGLTLSPKANSLVGKPVRVMGYMAPPLKAEAVFFVLMRAPASVCPFCSSDADWPADIMVVYPRQSGQKLHSAAPMAITGRLELGSKIDRETGFVSQVRIVDAELQKLR